MRRSPDGNWPVMAASDVAWSPVNQMPTPMTRADMDKVRDEFVAAVRMAIDAGFDMVELHAAHGYLLSGFLTPLQNKRTDEYGGGARKPPALSARSVRGDARRLAVGPADVGAHFGHRLGGRTRRHAGRSGRDRRSLRARRRGPDRRFGRPDLDRRAAGLRPHVPDAVFSDKLRNEARLATMAVGNIYEPDHANSILAAGRADLVALARPHLIDPFWTLRAAAQLDYRDIHVPPQYLNGMSQLARNLKREAEAAAALRV